MNAQLTGVQQRNLEAQLGRPVVDRLNLIIDIFGQRARTREAKLQACGMLVMTQLQSFLEGIGQSWSEPSAHIFSV